MCRRRVGNNTVATSQYTSLALPRRHTLSRASQCYIYFTPGVFFYFWKRHKDNTKEDRNEPKREHYGKTGEGDEKEDEEAWTNGKY